MYRILAHHGFFLRNVSPGSILNRMERSTQRCAFCKNLHPHTVKSTNNVQTRRSASAASLGDWEARRKVDTMFKVQDDLNHLLEDIGDADMHYITDPVRHMANSFEETVPYEEETISTLDDKDYESELSDTVSISYLQHNVSLQRKKNAAPGKGKSSTPAIPTFLSKMDYKFNRTNWYCCLMDAYTKTGNAVMAIKVLELARSYKIVKPGRKSQTIYNILIDHAVRESDHKTALMLFKYMLRDHVWPDVQTFISLLRMAKELTESKRKGFLLSMQGHMTRVNLTFNDLFERGSFQYDDRNIVLANVRLLYREFSPVYKFTPEGERDESHITHVAETRTSYKDFLDNSMDFRDMQVALKEQIRDEWEGVVEIENIALSKEAAVYRTIEKKQHAELESKWHDQLLASFTRHIAELEQLEKRNGSVEPLYPYLLLMDNDIYVDCMLKEVMMLCNAHHSFAKPYSLIAQELGAAVFKKYMVQCFMEMGVLDKMVDIHYRYLQWYSGLKDIGRVNPRNAWKRIQYEADKSGASSTTMIPKWPSELQAAIGEFLAGILVKDTTLASMDSAASQYGNEAPVFSVTYNRLGQHMVKEVECSPYINQIFKERGCTKLSFQTHELPSKCPPRPWCSPSEGGYYISNCCVLRRSRTMCSLQTSLLEAQSASGLTPVYDSLNILGAVPWKVNEPILDIVKEIFLNGGSEELDVPAPGSSIHDLPPITCSNKIEQHKFAKLQYLQKLKRQAVHSLWCDTLHRLSIANHYRGKLFWMPHTIDFRGRAYPIPPHLSHMCADLGRSLLLFGFGKPLGPHGLDWLKIHVINLSGLKKQCSAEHKLAYANEKLDDIIDSAERPINGNRWWAKTDTPWQVLASCIDIANAIKHPNPEEYVSYLPIHQDGSCNGLQHYAALGRDPFGAASVNLRKSDKPQDVYTVVVEQVEKMRKKDAANGVEIARALEGFITRKTIKQTIMTTVYGVTLYGARQQIERQLKAHESFPHHLDYAGSKYLAKKTFESLHSMFVSAKEIQEWLTMCARLIVRDCQRPVEWLTPMGLHVLQPYIKHEYTGKGIEQMKTILDGLKQRNAFAPNFIHSLDSSHMMLTCLHCDTANIAFASVHDCFWTHAFTVKDMNQICREQFVRLHKEPIIDNTYTFLLEYYNNKTSPSIEYSRQFETRTNVSFPKPPKRGQFNIEEVLDSTYFFS